MIASVRGVGLKRRGIEQVGGVEQLNDALPPAEGGGDFQLLPGHCGGVGGHGDHPISQQVVGRLEEKGGVHPAGKGHGCPAQLTEPLL